MRREPTEDEQAAVPPFSGTPDLAALLSALTRSDERFRSALAADGAPLVEALYRSLLDRYPSSKESASGVRALGQPVEWAGLVARLGNHAEHWNLLLRTRGDEILVELFHRLLGREPSEAERLQLEGSLTGTDAIARAAQRLAESEEYWQAQLAARSPVIATDLIRHLLPRGDSAVTLAGEGTAHLAEQLRSAVVSDEFFTALFTERNRALIDTIYQAVLGRAVDPEGLASYASQVTGPASVGPLIETLLDSEEYRERLRSKGLFRCRNADMVNAVYAALLGRPADQEGLANYGSWLVGAAELSQMIRTVTNSSEYRNRQRSQATVQEVPPAQRALEHIEALFRKFASRAPTLQEISGCLAAGEQVGRAVPDVLKAAAPPCDLAGKKVLLFGAFGNGNMGDAYQALAVRQHLMEAWGLESSQIFATTLLSSADYAFPATQKLPHGAIKDVHLVNQFDCLVIGGGGLLAHPHGPLFDGAWVRQIHVPIALLAVGAVAPVVANHRDLLARAWLVSGRDAESLAALRIAREDAFLCHDPILCLKNLEVLTAFDVEPPAPIADEGGADVLWVLKHPTSPDDIRFLREAAGLIAASEGVRHEIIAIEPDKDRVLEQYFPGQVRYACELSVVAPCFRQARLVVTMRYHGAIFAALAGKPSLGYAQKKIGTLYAEMNLAGAYALPVEELAQRVATPAISRAPMPVALRKAHTAHLKAAKSRLLV